jgi:hypothetical protein
MLSRAATVLDLAGCRYVGLGGPFLEDFRLIHEAFPTMNLTSIESKEQVWKRQKFHLPASKVTLHRCSVDHYFANIHDESERVVVWLDYTDCNNKRLREIWGLIQRLSDGSVLRVTLRAQGSSAVDMVERSQWATELFGEYLPDFEPDDVEYRAFPTMLLKGIHKVASSATANLNAKRFQLCNAISYDDGTQMLTLTGVVGDVHFCQDIRGVLRDWEFRNFNWGAPHKLTLPALSLKERLKLEPLLPSRRGTGKKLHKKLGYCIEGSAKESLEALDHYRRLAEAYPRFVRLAF